MKITHVLILIPIMMIVTAYFGALLALATVAR